MAGPLSGIRVIELAGIGPAPFGGMMLADLGADVIVVERASDPNKRGDSSRRGKRSIALNLKSKQGIDTLLKLIDKADVLIEGFRPGVTERLGIGPDACLARNPRLVYGRMTGWGQTGPMAQAAGHDINYISLTGALHAIGRKGDKPVPPLNLVGDFGGGGMLLIYGILAALLEAHRSGKGQVVDAAMTDGASLLMAMMYDGLTTGFWNGRERGVNMLDTGAPFYEVYETKDGKYISLGSIEPQFYAELIKRSGVAEERLMPQLDATRFEQHKQVLTEVFKTRTRDEWCALMEGTDVCFAPVLDLHEAPEHPHNKARGTFVKVDGVVQPAPAPRFSRTPGEIRHAAHTPGADTEQVLAEAGFAGADIAALRAAGALT
ncbi:MAG: CaiB/BaiF CoA transferase family protein [Gammaproteobacteria bacterium]